MLLFLYNSTNTAAFVGPWLLFLLPIHTSSLGKVGKENSDDIIATLFGTCLNILIRQVSIILVTRILWLVNLLLNNNKHRKVNNAKK